MIPETHSAEEQIISRDQLKLFLFEQDPELVPFFERNVENRYKRDPNRVQLNHQLSMLFQEHILVYQQTLLQMVKYFKKLIDAFRSVELPSDGEMEISPLFLKGGEEIDFREQALRHICLDVIHPERKTGPDKPREFWKQVDYWAKKDSCFDRNCYYWFDGEMIGDPMKKKIKSSENRIEYAKPDGEYTEPMRKLLILLREALKEEIKSTTIYFLCYQAGEKLSRISLSNQ